LTHKTLHTSIIDANRMKTDTYCPLPQLFVPEIMGPSYLTCVSQWSVRCTRRHEYYRRAWPGPIADTLRTRGGRRSSHFSVARTGSTWNSRTRPPHTPRSCGSLCTESNRLQGTTAPMTWQLARGIG